MRKILILFSAVLLVACQVSAQKEIVRTEDFSMEPGGNLEVRTSGGYIKVSGTNSSKAVVKMIVRSNKGYSESKIEEKLREDYEIEIGKSGNMLVAKAKGKSTNWNWGSGLSISFEITVPKKTNCDIGTSGGSLTMYNLEDELSAKTSGGSITLDEFNGFAELKTSGGSIKVNGFKGKLEGKTSGGSIKISEARGNLDIGTSGGSINMKDVSGTISASTSGGGINAEIMDVENSVELRTSGGSITASIPGNRGYDLDLKGNRVNIQLEDFTGSAEKNRVTGSMKGGGPEIAMSTSGGGVNVEFNRGM